MRKAILIEGDNGKITDLEDILNIAREIGRKLFPHAHKINVKPFLSQYEKSFLVIISPKP